MKTFAISLYENEAESEDELNFHKNELLQILQYDYLGMEGWYLCKLVKTSQVGLAAGNRLKVVTDDKLLAKFNSILDTHGGCKSPASSSNKPNFNNSAQTNLNSSNCSIVSSCSSNASIVSSNVSSPTDSSSAKVQSDVSMDFLKLLSIKMKGPQNWKPVPIFLPPNGKLHPRKLERVSPNF